MPDALDARPKQFSPDSPGEPTNTARIALAMAVGIPLCTGGFTALVYGGVNPGLAAGAAVFGGGLLVAASGLMGWSLARRPPPKLLPSTSQVFTTLIFGCAAAPTASWVDRLVELPREDRRAMALRSPRGPRSARWLADLLRTLEHRVDTLERVVLVVDEPSYPAPIRAALDRLVRSHVDPPRGIPPIRRPVAIEHLVLPEPNDPGRVFAVVSGKLHELSHEPGQRLAVAPTSGGGPPTIALTLAASLHACELITFPSPTELNTAPATFELRH
ncbi:MAG: hypothetical protein AAGA48_06475 [Myxococcota bacterium]